MGILTQHITIDPEPITQRAARAGRQLPPGLADVITCCMQKNPAQRFATMDDLVNVLIQIYRTIVGPGMSSYMEAFPVLPSASHPVQRTPPPMTGPVMISGAHQATIAANPSGPAMVVSAGSSGVYANPAPKSKLGIIIAIVAVVLVGGGVAAFVVVNHRGGGGNGSGSQIAGNDGSGSSQHGSARDGSSGTAGSGGSGIIARLGSGSADSGSNTTRDGSGSDATDHKGSDNVGGTLGSDSGSGQQSNLPPPVEVVLVVLSSRSASSFEVFEGDRKLFDGPEALEVPKGGTRTVLIKARGFKDKTLTIKADKKAGKFVLDRVPGSRPGPGSGSSSNQGSGSTHVIIPPPPPPPQIDCTSRLVDPTNKACRDQFCPTHKDHDKCQIE
jgi:hypothetical protein